MINIYHNPLGGGVRGGCGEQIELRGKLSFTKFEKRKKKRKWLKQISCPLLVFCRGETFEWEKHFAN